jgi:hypothetical protein
VSDTIKIEGLDHVVEDLQTLARKDAKRIVRKGLRRGGAVLRESERDEAPQRSGKLKKAIRVTSARAVKGKIAVTTGLRGKSFPEGHFYPVFVIRGYRTRGNSGTKVPPNDFLSRAFDRSAEAATQAATTTIENELASGF